MPWYSPWMCTHGSALVRCVNESFTLNITFRLCSWISLKLSLFLCTYLLPSVYSRNGWDQLRTRATSRRDRAERKFEFASRGRRSHHSSSFTFSSFTVEILLWNSAPGIMEWVNTFAWEDEKQLIKWRHGEVLLVVHTLCSIRDARRECCKNKGHGKAIYGNSRDSKTWP